MNVMIEILYTVYTKKTGNTPEGSDDPLGFLFIYKNGSSPISEIGKPPAGYLRLSNILHM